LVIFQENTNRKYRTNKRPVRDVDASFAHSITRRARAAILDKNGDSSAWHDRRNWTACESVDADMADMKDNYCQ